MGKGLETERSENQKLQQKNNDLDSEIDRLQQEIDGKDTTIQSKESDIKSKDSEIDILRKELDELKKKLIEDGPIENIVEETKGNLNKLNTNIIDDRTQIINDPPENDGP